MAWLLMFATDDQVERLREDGRDILTRHDQIERLADYTRNPDPGSPLTWKIRCTS